MWSTPDIVARQTLKLLHGVRMQIQCKLCYSLIDVNHDYRETICNLNRLLNTQISDFEVANTLCLPLAAIKLLYKFID